MTEREKIAHLLRRFGLGAGRTELAKWESLGYKGAVDKLLNDDRTLDQYNVSHWELATQPDMKVDPNAYLVGVSWALRMMCTERPFQEKLTLFWHDHFALDAEKIYEAPTMLGYLDTIRANGRGKFRDLLRAVVKQGAVLFYLDNHVNNLIKPNENFAREIFELFTLGEGNYTERDIKEAARAFTGWSVHYANIGLDIPYEKVRDTMTRAKLAMGNFCEVPALHDNGVKTILGKTGRFTGDDVIDIAANHPQTMRYICGKLWNYFGSPNAPTVQTQEAIYATWKKTDGEIRAVLRTIAESPEFVSAGVVNQKVKSPVDWTIALFRSLGTGDTIRLAHPKAVDDFVPLQKELRDAAGGLYYLMSQQGLQLLFPPDVGGWEWDEGWITADNLLKRTNHSGTIFWGGGESRPFAVGLASKISSEDKPRTTADLVKAMCEILDVPLNATSITSYITLADKHGGLGALGDKNRSANLFAQVSKVMFAAPEMQLM